MKKISDFSDFDSYLFHTGKQYYAYRFLGAHLCSQNGEDGAFFRLYAPNALSVSVITEANSWDESASPMAKRPDGIWECFVPGADKGHVYRYAVTGADGVIRYKSDPYAFFSEKRPSNGSVIFPLDGYSWHDGGYLSGVKAADAPLKPMAIYEVHLGSWKKDYSLNPDGFLNYRELANQLSQYLDYMGYTHVELIGICEHPFDGSWGYQVTGFFSPTSRYGTPDDFRYFVDVMHDHNIGVILDWVPAHFPKDSFGLACFDGTHLYESDDPLRAEYPEWGTLAFDHGRPEVCSFLVSSAFYWVSEFHIDALRVDAVAAMLYSSFSRASWRPNIYGGCENLESMAFLKNLNSYLRAETQAYLIAEDSSTLPGITRPVEEGGFGFMFKWNMGWMNDTLRYMAKDPFFRRYHHSELTRIADYSFLENFVLVLSHDEVVHLKHSMLEKFPGGIEDKFGSLKAMYAFQFTFPGKKLIFMGQDIAEDREWDENREVNWALAEQFGHRDVMQCLRNLLSLYRTYPALYSDTMDERTFQWIRRDDSDRNIISYIRRNPWNYNGAVLAVCNFSPVQYSDYSCGAPLPGYYNRLFSTYDSLPGGGSPEEEGGIPPVTAVEGLCDGLPYRLSYSLRPFEAVVFSLPEESEAVPE